MWKINWQGAVVITRLGSMVTSARSGVDLREILGSADSYSSMVARSKVGVRDDTWFLLFPKKAFTIP